MYVYLLSSLSSVLEYSNLSGNFCSIRHFKVEIVDFDWENSISFAISHDSILLVAFNMLFSLLF